MLFKKQVDFGNLFDFEIVCTIKEYTVQYTKVLRKCRKKFLAGQSTWIR